MKRYSNYSVSKKNFLPLKVVHRMVKDKTLALSFGAWWLNRKVALAPEIYWALQTVSIKCRLQTADCKRCPSYDAKKVNETEQRF